MCVCVCVNFVRCGRERARIISRRRARLINFSRVARVGGRGLFCCLEECAELPGCRRMNFVLLHSWCRRSIVKLQFIILIRWKCLLLKTLYRFLALNLYF